MHEPKTFFNIDRKSKMATNSVSQPLSDAEHQ